MRLGVFLKVQSYESITVLAEISWRVASSIASARICIVTWGGVVAGRRIVVVRIRIVTIDRGSIRESRIVVVGRLPKCSITKSIGITIGVTVLIPIWVLVTITDSTHANTDASILSVRRCCQS